MAASDGAAAISIHIPVELAHFAISKAEYLRKNPQYGSLAVGACIFSEAAMNTSSATPQMLLIQRASSERSFPNLWEIPGGASEATDPTILHSVAREVFEETGLRLSSLIRLAAEEDLPTGSVAEPRVWKKLTFEIVVQEMSSEASLPLIVELDTKEHQAYRWVSEDDLIKHGIAFLGHGQDQRKIDIGQTTCKEGELKLISTRQQEILRQAFRQHNSSSQKLQTS